MAADDLPAIEFGESRNQYSVILPCKPEDFGAFVAGLLGRPQIITGNISGPFEVDRNDIENLYHLIGQHAFAQENTTLISFNVRIVHDDGSSIIFDSFEDFQSYNEIRAVRSTAVVLSWILLVKFRSRKTLEKQQIDISLNAGHTAVEETQSARQSQAPFVYDHERIAYRISHTNRSWGTSVQFLLAEHLANYQKSLVGILGFVSRNSVSIGVWTGIVVFIVSIFLGLSITNEYIARYAAESQKFIDGNEISIESVNSKISFLINPVVSGVWSRYSFYGTIFFIVAIIGSIIFGIIMGSVTSIQRRSFVAITKKSVDEMTCYPQHLKKHWIAIGVAAIGAALASASGKIIFLIATKFLNI